MSLPIALIADALVAVLLLATIVTSLRLSQRMARLKSNETHMRQTIAELLVATDSAERAIAGLRATVSECDRTLGDRLRNAELTTAQLEEHIQAGEAVMSRVGRIADAMRRDGVGVRPDGPAPPPARGGEGLKVAALAARNIADRAARRIEGRAA